MIDFTNLPTRKKAYGGANGSKLSVIYNNELYMLKLPMHALKNPNLSYTNICTSEYLGCHIFNMLGVKAQETLLGYGKQPIPMRSGGSIPIISTFEKVLGIKSILMGFGLGEDANC